MLHQLRIAAAWFLLAFLAWGQIPPEAVHAFSGHEDTEHHDCCRTGLVHLEEEHVHCEMLQWQSPVYLFNMPAAVYCTAHPVFFRPPAPLHSCYQVPAFTFSDLPAPPFSLLS